MHRNVIALRDFLRKRVRQGRQRMLSAASALRARFLNTKALLRSWLRTPWSIRRVVRREEREWLAQNASRKAYALSWFKSDLLFAGEHPVRFAASLLALHLAVVGDLYCWLPTRLTLSGVQLSDRLAHFSTLWAVQATLAALVYPIVIAFVTVFLQRRPAAQTFVHLYVLESGAFASGLSSLGLIAAMAVQYVFIGPLGIDLPLWVEADAIWFAMNAALTTYFLFRSVDFLRPDVQMGVARGYAIAIALPRDVARLNLFQALARAQSEGWIDAPSYGVNDDAPGGPSVWLSSFSLGGGSVQATYRLRLPKQVADARLWFLRLAVAGWMRSARRLPPPEGAGKVFGDGNWPLLTVAPTPGRTYLEDVPLARVVRGPSLSAFQRLLLRKAFVFRRPTAERFGISVTALLGEVEADVRHAAASDEAGSFERAYEQLISLHESLLTACLVKTADGSFGSWAMLPDIHKFGERRLHELWGDAYRSVYEAAISAITRNTKPAQRLCHLIQHLRASDWEQMPVEILEHLLLLPTLMMFQLGGWWARQAEEQGYLNRGPGRGILLKPPVLRFYEEIVMSFVSGWESARDAVAPVPEAGAPITWLVVQRLARLNVKHLQETARMLMGAVDRGDRLAAEWLADIMSKWFDDLQYDQLPIALYDKQTYLTVDHLMLDWDVAIRSLGADEPTMLRHGEPLTVLQRGLLMAALKNFLTDMRLVVIELLLFWAMRDEAPDREDSLAVDIAAGLISGRQWRQGGALTEPLTHLAAYEFLQANVRQFAAGGQWRVGYTGRLDAFVSRIKDMERPEMVSSRVYSGFGADDLDSLMDQQLLVFAAVSNAAWTADGLGRQVDIWMTTQYPSIAILQQKVASWLQRLNMPELPSQPVLQIFASKARGEVNPAEAWSQVRQGLQSFQALLQARRNDALIAAPIDPERLTAIAVSASRRGFAREGAGFPVNIFQSIQFTAEPANEFTLTLQQVRKGELTAVEMDQRAINSQDWWERTMSDRVCAVAMADVLGQCRIVDQVTTTPETYWAALKSGATRLRDRGETPILLVDNPTQPRWLWQWQHAYPGNETERPVDLGLQHRQIGVSGYQCTLAGVDVYSAPISPGRSLLMSQETFRTLTFRRYSEDKLVSVAVAGRSDSQVLVDLQVTFSRDVSIGPDEVIGLVYQPMPAGEDEI